MTLHNNIKNNQKKSETEGNEKQRYFVNKI